MAAFKKILPARISSNTICNYLFFIFFLLKLLDVEVLWNKKLRTTAGFCKYKGLYNSRSASIDLSTKVVDDFGKYVYAISCFFCGVANHIDTNGLF